MNCNNCGYFNNQPVNNCMNCGAPLVNMNYGSIVITRPSNFVGIILPYSVKVDGVYMGDIADGQTQCINVPFGQHLVSIEHGFNKGETMVMINSEQRVLTFNCPIKMGFWKNTIEFQLMNVSR